MPEPTQKSEPTQKAKESESPVVKIFLIVEYSVAVMKSTQLLYDAFWELGYDLDLEGERGRGFTVLQKISEVGDELSGAYQDVADLAKRPPKKFSEVTKVLKLLGKLAGSGARIYTLVKEEGSDVKPGFDKDVFLEHTGRLGGLLLLKNLEFFLPQVYHGLVLTMVIQPGSESTLKEHLRDAEGKIIRFPHATTEVDWNQLGKVFDDPAQLIIEEYLSEPEDQAAPPQPVSELEDPQLEKLSKKLFKRLRKFLTSTGANVVVGLKPADWLDFEDPVARQVNERTLSFWYEFLDDNVEVGASLVFIRQPNREIGLGVLPFGGVKGDFNVKDWTVQIDATQFIHPFVINGSDEQAGDTETRLTLTLTKGQPGKEKAYIIGGTEDTRLELGQIMLQGGLDFSSDKRDAGFLLEFADSRLVVVPDSKDGFLSKVVPAKGVNVEFELGLGWSSAFGWYIKGGTGLEVELPKHLEFGKIFTLTAVQAGLHASNQEVRMYTAVSGKVKLGPFLATVESIGMQALWTFDNPQAENPESTETLFDFDVKPPKGVGIKVDAKAVKGAGYLYFDKEKGQYAGVVELTVKETIKVKAIGIITTKMPDGSKGYSFLLIVSVEFSPVQLGLGFTLNGVGGLIGLNRTMDASAIRLGLRENTLDDVLFPTKPLENAKRIINSANTIFPPHDGQYVFGLMALIGWGAKSLITFEIGLLIEVPDPFRLAIVGIVRALISKKALGKERTVLKLQVNFAGIVDFDKNYFSFDASLFDSALLSFRLEGDMALRVQWGQQKCFLLSVGGFHPDFNEIPEGFPPMNRLMLALVDRKNAQIILTFYMAITPNTFQIGAGVFFYFKIWKFKVNGGFAFDALFYSRSNFLVRITAFLKISWGSKTLVDVVFKGTFTGTTPWRLQGEATIKVLFWSKTLPVDETCGEEIGTRVQTVSLLPELEEALHDIRNWQEVTPSATRLLVTVKKEEQAENYNHVPILLHPTGGVAISQSVLPLTIRLDKFGPQALEGATRFDLQLVDGEGQDLAVLTERDAFAPAMYLDLTEEEKLSRKSYESFPAGVKMKQADHVTVGSFREKTVVYERKVLDDVQKPSMADLYQEEGELFSLLSMRNTVGQSEFGHKAKFAHMNGIQPLLMPHEEYVLVYQHDLMPYGDNMRYQTQTEAWRLLEEIVEENPELEPQLAVVPAYELA